MSGQHRPEYDRKKELGPLLHLLLLLQIRFIRINVADVADVAGFRSRKRIGEKRHGAKNPAQAE